MSGYHGTRRLRRSILLLPTVLISVALAAGVVELATRLWVPSWSIPIVGAHFSARYHHVFDSARTRWLGFRPELPSLRQTVVVVGDSFVHAMETAPSSRFTSLLEAELDGRAGSTKARVINLGHTSYSTILYERVYRDIVLPLNPQVVVIALDQTDMIDDFLYEQELSPSAQGGGIDHFNDSFSNTILARLESTPVTAFLAANSRSFLLLTRFLKERLNMEILPTHEERDRAKLDLYIETCRKPESRPELFNVSLKYLESIFRLRPRNQRLYIVTYPRAEHLAGQPKTTLINGAIDRMHSSTPFFEFWIEQTRLAEKYPEVTFVHASSYFRAATNSGAVYYLHEGDVHWNQKGHQLFTSFLKKTLQELRNR